MSIKYIKDATVTIILFIKATTSYYGSVMSGMFDDLLGYTALGDIGISS
jgi:hypothetical protein